MKTDLDRSSPRTRPERTSIGQLENHQAIADRMEALAIELRSISDNRATAVPSDATMVALAAKIYSARRKVDEVFGMTGFSVSPGWDIILDLYQAWAQNKEISVSSACIGAACPPTTGLRWLQALENMQLIERKQDDFDKRRIVVSLTECGKIKAAKALTHHL